MRGQGLVLRDGRADVQPWLAGLVTAGARFRVSRWIALDAQLEGYGAFVRPRFLAQTATGPQLLYAPSPVGGRVLVGIVVGPFLGDGNPGGLGVSTSR